MRFISFLIVVVGLSLGAVLGYLFILKLPTINLERHHFLYSWFGVREREVVGFLPYWLVKSTPLSYDPYLTTLTYFGLVLQEDGSIQKKVNSQELEPGWNMLGSMSLKERLDEAKRHGILLSLLVHLADEEKITSLLTKPEDHAHALINEIEPLMREYGFNDLNIDIESFVTATIEEQQRFTTFIKVIKQELISRKLGTLTVEMSPSVLVKPLLINAYDVGFIADQIILMAYDYHYSGSFVTGPVAPLGGAGIDRELDVATSIQAAEQVIPKDKLVLGIPLYGYEWETLKPNHKSAVIPGSGRSATNKRVAELLQTCRECKTGIEDTSQESFILYPDPKDDSFRVIFIGDSSLVKRKLATIGQWKGSAVWALGYEDTQILEPLIEYKSSRWLEW